MLRIYRYARYKARFDLSGHDLVGLCDQPRQMAKTLLPMLKEASTMSKRLGLARRLRAYNGEMADEVHQFDNVSQGNFRLERLLLREGRVIEVTCRW